MYRSAPRRVAAICLAMLLATPAWAAAGDGILHGLCRDKHACSETTRVTLPARQVEVVTEQPRVVVREMTPAREVAARCLHRTAVTAMVPAAAPVAIGTVYMPVSLPHVQTVPLVGAAPCREVTEGNPLEAAHQAEVLALQSDHARARLAATIEAQNRVMARLTGGRAAVGVGSSDPGADILQKLSDLQGKLNQLNDRVTSVEKLLVIHDEVIRQKVLGVPPSAGATPNAPMPLPPPTPMVPPTKIEVVPPKTSIPMIPPMLPPG